MGGAARTAGPSQTRLCLVENQKHAPPFAMLLESREVSFRQLNDAARAQDRLEYTAGERSRRLTVDETPSKVELGFPVVRAVSAAEGGSEGVRGGKDKMTGSRGAITCRLASAIVPER